MNFKIYLCVFLFVLFSSARLQTTIEKKITKITFLPILFYTPETRLAGGALVNFNFYQPEDTSFAFPSTILPDIIYTANKQLISEFYTDWYFQNNRYHFTGGISYIDFPDLFYGVGSASPSSDEEKFTQRAFILQSMLQEKFFNFLEFGIKYTLIYHDIYKFETNKQISQNHITGSTRGYVSGFGAVITLDSRDNKFFPGAGRYLDISYIHAGHELGSDYTFNQITLNWRRYFTPVLNHVFALQFIGDFESGDPPFQLMTKLGGSNILRGYYDGRYRDRNMMALQAEYRAMIFSRVGFALFTGIGDVRDGLSKFNLSGTKSSYGLGIRFKLSKNEKINLRADYGLAGKDSGFYLTMKEAF